MTWHEIAIKYPDYWDDMTAERKREYVNDCFDIYESTEKLADTFWTPYDSYQDKIGQTFEVVRRLDEKSCDLCTLPMWRIMLADGTELDAYPEEIYEREQKDNGRFTKELNVHCNLYLSVEGDTSIDEAIDALLMRLDPDIGINIHDSEFQEV